MAAAAGSVPTAGVLSAALGAVAAGAIDGGRDK